MAAVKDRLPIVHFTPEIGPSESPPLVPFITSTVMVAAIRRPPIGHAPSPHGDVDRTQKPQPGILSVRLSPELDIGMTPPLPSTPGPQRAPVS